MLDWNQLNGSIPPEIGNLVNLNRLSIVGNHLTGEIPAEIGNLVSLTILNLGYNKLNGSIPFEMGKLVSAGYIRISQNELSGTIPSQIGLLQGLGRLILNGNRQLDGTYTPQCYTTSGATPVVSISGTGVTICGCLSSSTPPAIFPPPGSPDACLSVGPALSLSKRILAFSQVIGSFKYTCNTDANKNPYADCLNTMAKICNTADTSFDKTRCHTGVNMMFGNMSTHWQAVRKECGQWSWNGYPASSTAASSSYCATANSNLRTNAFYIHNGIRVPVDLGLTESTNVGLWSKVTA